MAQFYQNIGHVVLMLVLLCGSAFFSGAETAFFSLSRRQIKLLGESRHKLQHLATKLLTRSGKLLSCLLFGNMIVNVLFFAVASVLAMRLQRQSGVTAAAVSSVVSFSVLVVFGEILPKSLAYGSAKSLSVTLALPVFACVKVFSPVVSTLEVLVVEPAIRLLLGCPRPANPVTADEFKLLIEQVRKRGLITADENRLLSEIVKLGFLKVRDCLRPRVDMIACDVKDSTETASELMRANQLTKIAVYSETIDNIIGLVYFRRLLLEPEAPLEKLVQQVNFVPEQKTVESLLEFFRKSGTDTAIVVDEYGGIAGSVCLEDIAEELLGPIEITGGIEPIEQVGPLEYRLAGDLGIHDWAQSFGIDRVETRMSTLAGLVTALLGKVPKEGDVTYLRNLKFTVERMRKRRIETLLLTLEPIKTDA